MRVLVAMWLGVFAFLHATAAFARESKKKEECAAAYEKSQELRASDKLHEARDALVICAQDACPSFVQADCTQWLAEVQRDMPTIVFAAKDQNRVDTASVAVILDGELLLSELDGKAVAIDPGQHTVHFEHAGADPIEQQIVVREGEKDRVVEVSFAPVGADLGRKEDPYGATTASRDVGTRENRPFDRTRLRPYAYVAGGVGAAGLISFAVFGLVGKSQQSDLEHAGCRPDCSQNKVDAIHTKYTLADISLGIGVAGVGGGVALYFLSRPKTPSHASDAGLRLDVKAAPGSARLNLSGAF
ncbi:MAG TPA: hypothetical protein VH142_21095 [Polyangiaceae bacterium]|jgi:hypothetical protein|nr:hypothetical protein [Polyangiaceae bacterium]